MPQVPKDVPADQLPLARCLCTWWRIAAKDYFKAKCVGCEGTIRRLDAVDRLVYAGRIDEVTMRDFEQAKREHDRWATE